MSSKIKIDNASGQVLVDDQSIAALAITANAQGASQTLMSNSSLAWAQQDAILSWRNKFINGDMSVDQRNAGAQINIANAAIQYPADRWFVYSAGATSTAQRVSVTTLPGFNFATRVNYIAGATNYSLTQRVESKEMAGLVGRFATVSLWVFNSLATSTTFYYSFGYPSAVDNYTTSPTFNVGSTTIPAGWSKFVISVNIPSECSNGAFFSFRADVATASQYYMITGAQLEVGSIATPFEYLPYSENLNLCKRYYAKYSANATGSVFGAGAWATTTLGYVFLKYEQQMRSAPTITLTGITLSNGAAKTYSSMGSIYAGTDSALIGVNTSTTAAVGNGALLQASSTSGSITINSEI